VFPIAFTNLVTLLFSGKGEEEETIKGLGLKQEAESSRGKEKLTDAPESSDDLSSLNSSDDCIVSFGLKSLDWAISDEEGEEETLGSQSPSPPVLAPSPGFSPALVDVETSQGNPEVGIPLVESTHVPRGSIDQWRGVPTRSIPERILEQAVAVSSCPYSSSLIMIFFALES
jgi:hypothetical protein